jgi:hypothetical protein
LILFSVPLWEEPMSWLITILLEVPDPRTGNATPHDLLDVLTIVPMASICGCENCVEFADFAEDREELFREFLGLENGMPSHDTFTRLFRHPAPAASPNEWTSMALPFLPPAC